MINLQPNVDLLDRHQEPTGGGRNFSATDFLRLQNDSKKAKEYQNFRETITLDNLTPQRAFDHSGEWASFLPTVYLDGILEHTSFSSIASQLGQQISQNTGLNFSYREYESFHRAQRGSAENTEFQRKKGVKRTQEVPFYVNGIRASQSETERIQVPINVLQMEMRAQTNSLILERDLLFVDSMMNACSGTNAITFNNVLQCSGDVTFADLHLALTWFQSPFNATATNLTVSNPFTSGNSKLKTEGLMRINRFKPTHVLMNTKNYWNLINNSNLTNNYWFNSKILETGNLQIPILGVEVVKCLVGSYLDPNDPESFVESDDIFIVDKNNFGFPTVNQVIPMTIKTWFDNPSLTDEVIIYEKLGMAVQNRRSLLRITSGS